MDTVGNEEMLYQSWLNGDNEVSIEPANRKERLLKAIVEKFQWVEKGYDELRATVDGSVTQIQPDDLAGATKVKPYAFYSCTSLLSVALPDSVTQIGTSAFASCSSLDSTSLGNAVTSIGANAFLNCSALTGLEIKTTTPPTLANTNAFSGTNANMKIYVPADSVAAYKAASNWSTYADQIKAIS